MHGALRFAHSQSAAIRPPLEYENSGRKREVPRPVAHKACLDGFKAGLEATTLLVNKKIEAVSAYGVGFLLALSIH